MLRIVGDVHGKWPLYLGIATRASQSLQVGDMGFSYDWMERLDPERHRFIGGNHDRYDSDGNGGFLGMPPHYTGDFGTLTFPEFGDLFFVRGGYSIDKKYRTEGVSWWPDEELSHSIGLAMLEEYERLKPDFVVTHEAPRSVIPFVSSASDRVLEEEFGCKLPSRTSELLEQMLEIHRPKTWVFGHFHQNVIHVSEGTEFICLNELCHLDFDEQQRHSGKIVNPREALRLNA